MTNSRAGGDFVTNETTERRLVAILAVDVVGYSRLMGVDEEGTLTRLKTLRRELVDPTISSHRGRIVKTTGDGILTEFASAVDAVRCAAEVQRGMAARNVEVAPDKRIDFRIGMHVGDVIIDDDDIFGDGVNIASRLEGISEPGGICLSDDAKRQIHAKIDIGLEDMGLRDLKNIALPMRAWRVRLDGVTVAPTWPNVKNPLTLPDKPSIAVLPFQNMSGDPEQEYFADGMVEDIIAALSRFESLFVIARNSSFTYKGQAVEIKQVGLDLGVRYVLEGSVRKSGEKVRITGQLIDAETGAHIWVDKFDGVIDDLFDLQDRVAAHVVSAIAPKIDQAEIERVARKPPGNLQAYDWYLKARASGRIVGDLEKNKETLDFCRRAIDLAPEMAVAYGLAAVCYNLRKMYGWFSDEQNERAEAKRFVESAVKFGQNDAMALSNAAIVYAFLFFEVEKAATLVGRAISLNPNLANAWQVRAWTCAYLGDHDLTLKCVDHAMRLNPLDPLGYNAENAKAFSLMLMGRYDDAVLLAGNVLARTPRAIVPLRVAAVCHGLTGRLDQAKAAMKLLLELNPGSRLSNVQKFVPLRRPEDEARMIEGYRLAGMLE